MISQKPIETCRGEITMSRLDANKAMRITINACDFAGKDGAGDRGENCVDPCDFAGGPDPAISGVLVAAVWAWPRPNSG
jgi:hypothetical protein